MPSGPVLRASRGHGVRHRLERRRRGDGELVREPAPDQPEPGDRGVGPLDAVGVGLGDHDAEVAHVLGRLAQRRGVEPRHGDRALLAEELAGDRGALGHRHEVGDRLVDPADPLVERQRQQLARPRARAGRALAPRDRRRQRPGSAAGSGPWSPARCRTSRRRRARPRAPAPGSRRRWCRATARASPGRRRWRARSGSSRRPRRRPRRRRPRSQSSPGAEKAASRVFAASISRPEPAEAAGAGLADAFELGAHFAAADHGEPDADAFLSHGCLRPPR